MAHTAEKLKRITITLPKALLEEAETWLAHEDVSRSQLIQEALRVHLRHLKTRRLQTEAAKLSQEEEALAEEGFEAVNEVWPEY